MNFNPNIYQTQSIFTPETLPNISTNDKETIKDVLSAIKALDTKLDKVTQEVESLKEITYAHTVKLEELQNVLRPASINLRIFPISSLTELNAAEELIKTKTDSEVISYMKSRFDRMKLEKILSKIFHENVLLKINWDGKKEKTAINNFKLFKYFLFESVKGNFDSYGQFENAMKIGFRKCKATFYRKTYFLKSTSNRGSS